MTRPKVAKASNGAVLRAMSMASSQWSLSSKIDSARCVSWNDCSDTIDARTDNVLFPNGSNAMICASPIAGVK